MTVEFESLKVQARLDYVYKNVLSVGAKGYVLLDDYLRVLTEFSNGGGDGEVNRFWVQNRQLTLASGTDLLDLAGGLVDVYGNTITFSAVKAILVRNKGMLVGGEATPTRGEDLLVGGAAASAFASPFYGDGGARLLVRSGGVLLLCAPYDGYSVSPGTGDVLQVEHAGSEASGGDIEYDIAIAGVQ